MPSKKSLIVILIYSLVTFFLAGFLFLVNPLIIGFIVCFIEKKETIKYGLISSLSFAFLLVIFTMIASLILPPEHYLLGGRITSSYFLGTVLYFPLAAFEGFVAGLISSFIFKTKN